ncbi:MAG: sulfatase [Verrucomicrobiota bacterium]|nr:sulfatase [Verrucomicrobiota bacterium]
MNLFRTATAFLCFLFAINLANAKPNVLLIVCDDLNTHVSTSGYPHIKTPHLDRLAKESLIFNRAYCQYPVCGPSRASFLSGLYPESTGVLNNKIDIRETRPGTPSLPQFMKENGYWTGGVGKIFHTVRHEPGDLGWNEYHRFENDEFPFVTEARKKFEAGNGSIERGKPRRQWKEKLSKLFTQTRGQQTPGYGPSGLNDSQHRDGRNARKVVEWIDKKSYGDKPFFITVGIHKPHVPFIAPQKYFDLYPKRDLQFELSPANDWSDIPKLAMVKRFSGFGFELGRENDPLRREYTQAYHACVSFVDAQVGLILDKLRTQKLWDDTIVVFTSDHGYHLGEHFMWGKVTLFEECARVPLVVRVPGVSKAGTRSDGLVETIDLFPTLAMLCDLAAPAYLQGQSYAELIQKPDGSGKPSAYTVVSRGTQLGRSIRTKRWRYAEWGEANAAELYDLEKDPREYSNLAKSLEHGALVKRMKDTLAKRRKQAEFARNLSGK